MTMTYEEFEKRFEEFGERFEYVSVGDQDYGFSWKACPICGRELGGDRFQVLGYRRMEGLMADIKVHEIKACQDCYDYAANGHLDEFEGEINVK